MNTHIALLRGINVGGKNIIKMDMLKQCFVAMGFPDVKTYIQSGNVVFKTADTDKTKLIEIMENKLLEMFSIEIKTMILTADELMETVENAPENFGSQPDKFRYDVWFMLPWMTVTEIMSHICLREGVDFVQAGKNVMYTSRLTSEMNKSYLQKIIQTPFYKSVTIRNWNTTIKLLKMVDNNTINLQKQYVEQSYMPRTALRYAIEKMPDHYKAEAMLGNRPVR